MAHGTQDPVVPYPLGDESHQLLKATGYRVEWHAYPMPHSLCEPEVADLRAWLSRVCAALDPSFTNARRRRALGPSRTSPGSGEVTENLRRARVNCDPRIGIRRRLQGVPRASQ